jgi:hypothetical protein
MPPVIPSSTPPVTPTPTPGPAFTPTPATGRVPTASERRRALTAPAATPSTTATAAPTASAATPTPVPAPTPASPATPTAVTFGRQADGSYRADYARVLDEIGTGPTYQRHFGESHQCVAFTKHFSSAPQTAQWRRGTAVWGNTDLAPGTAIATFNQDGRYPSASGWNSAIYVSQDDTGILIIDQWPGHPAKPRVIVPNSPWGRPNDASEYSVIRVP